MLSARGMRRWVQKQIAVAWIGKGVRSCGPYIIIELVLPGGTLISLLLYLYRRRIASQALQAPAR